MEPINVGDVYFDERNLRYLTVVKVYADFTYLCSVEELTKSGYDFEVTGTALFTIYELSNMDRMCTKESTEGM